VLVEDQGWLSKGFPSEGGWWLSDKRWKSRVRARVKIRGVVWDNLLVFEESCALETRSFRQRRANLRE
jgi:hypothetical protein